MLLILIKIVRAFVKIVLGFSFFFTTLSKIDVVFFVFFDYLCNSKEGLASPSGDEPRAWF